MQSANYVFEVAILVVGLNLWLMVDSNQECEYQIDQKFECILPLLVCVKLPGSFKVANDDEVIDCESPF